MINDINILIELELLRGGSIWTAWRLRTRIVMTRMKMRRIGKTSFRRLVMGTFVLVYMVQAMFLLYDCFGISFPFLM